MGRIVFGIIGLIIGAIGGTLFGGALLGGSATGIGIATGISAGVCSTVIAATEERLLDAEQVEQVLARAVTDLGGTMDAAPQVTTVAQCEELMQNLMSETGG